MGEYPLEDYLAQLRRIEAHRAKGTEQEIRKAYKNILKEMQEFFGVEYARYGVDGALTYADLQRQGEYARFLETVESRLSGISPEVSALIQNSVEQAYTASYAGMVGAVGKAGGMEAALIGLRGITPEVVKRAVENPVAGLTLKDTLEHNRREIIYNIKRAVGVGLTQGDSYTTMAKRIAQSLDQDYRKSITVARTETHRVVEAGRQDAAEQSGAALKEHRFQMVKIWRTMEDSRVRDGKRGANHRSLNGVSVPVEESFDLGRGVQAKAPGQSGDAGNDINCRCYLSYELAKVEKLPKYDTIDLTQEESRALNEYISSGSYKINASLREGIALTEEQAQMAESLDAAIGKMPIYQGATFRSLSTFGIGDVDAFIASYTIGAYKEFSQYLSSGTAVYDDSFLIQYVIKSKNGRDIRAYNPGELEILFPRGTGFYVTKIDDKTIYMEEA